MSVPGLTLPEGLIAADRIFKRFGLDDYMGMVTAEMYSRPVPHVFKEVETKAITDLYEKWAPEIIKWLIPQIRAPYQTFNKVSRCGWPDFTRPDNKLAVVMQYAPAILAGDLSAFEDGYLIMNVRCQVDPKDKEREFQFVGDDNKVYQRTITSKDKLVKTPIGKRICSRTRLVFNLPIYNLVKQVWDTAVHNAILKHPAFHHDMNNKKILPVRGFHLCLDVKHFERHTASCNRVRAAAYGGVYGKCSELTARLPFAVPTDSWNGVRMLYVNRSAGYSDQYGSGDSAVSPSQKEILIAIYASFFEMEFNLDKQEAIRVVAAGGNEWLTIRNYGDDNSISGDEGCCRAFMAYAGQFLHVEEEIPPKFLGFVWYPEFHQWMLPKTAYLLKTYLNERAPGTNFRKYPNLGWVEKRKVFSAIGHPEIARDIFPFEDALLLEYGVPWFSVEQRAAVERRQAAIANVRVDDPLFVMDKEYAMTAEQKMATGDFQGLPPNVTSRWIHSLISKEISSQLKL